MTEVVLTPKDYVDRAMKLLHNDPSDDKVSQRKRGVSFREEYRMMRNSRTRTRAPSMIHEPTKDMIPPKRKEVGDKITVILDLDETLIYARNGPLFARPHLDLLFEFLKDHCETVVWTAGVKAYAQCVIKNIDPSGVIEHCIYRHKRWFSGKAGYQKDLTMLGRDMDKVLIVENTPDCIRGNPDNGVLVKDYEGETNGGGCDSTIPRLTKFIAKLVESGDTVPAFLKNTEMVNQNAIHTTDGGYLVYSLNSENKQAYSKPMLNRDLLENPDVLPHDAVPLHIPLSPGGTYHNDWINNVTL
eukprot:TRINITY_DN14497_c0_g1_i1.p1 TRINITY_DN14497_c0_g1~~TRINITY_DN14497_c0_g1_i1.p1  ORF type:complete len:300 (+),score=32.16 TRINITY_DN14497_c0_g1_i1:57-956(+)